MVLELQKNGAISTESSHVPLTITPSPVSIIIDSYINMVHLLRWMNQYWYIMNVSP